MNVEGIKVANRFKHGRDFGVNLGAHPLADFRRLSAPTTTWMSPGASFPRPRLGQVEKGKPASASLDGICGDSWS
jgi:hypothetical protein